LRPARGPARPERADHRRQWAGHTVKLLSPSEDSLRAVLLRLGAVVPLDSAPVEQVAPLALPRYQPALVFNSQSFETIARLEEHRPLAAGPGHPDRAAPPLSGGAPSRTSWATWVKSPTTTRQEALGPGSAPSWAGRRAEQQACSVRGRGRQARRGERAGRDGAGGSVLAFDRRAEPAAAQDHDRLAAPAVHRSPWGLDPVSWRAGRHESKGEILASTAGLPSTPTTSWAASRHQLPRAHSDSAGLPLYNRAIKGAYPPASPFKLATAAMALRRGIVTFSTHMDSACRAGSGSATGFKCWKKEGHGSLDLTGAIAASCDVPLPARTQARARPHARRRGRARVPERSGIDLGAESRSLSRSRAWYDSTYGPRGWTNAVTLNLAIGQGENSRPSST
jgi:penicillin-binding protein 2